MFTKKERKAMALIAPIPLKVCGDVILLCFGSSSDTSDEEVWTVYDPFTKKVGLKSLSGAAVRKAKTLLYRPESVSEKSKEEIKNSIVDPDF